MSFSSFFFFQQCRHRFIASLKVSFSRFVRFMDVSKLRQFLTKNLKTGTFRHRKSWESRFLEILSRHISYNCAPPKRPWKMSPFLWVSQFCTQFFSVSVERSCKKRAVIIGRLKTDMVWYWRNSKPVFHAVIRFETVTFKKLKILKQPFWNPFLSLMDLFVA